MASTVNDQILDLASRIAYLSSQPLTLREQQWIRENRISLIIELAAQRGYHQTRSVS